MSPWSDVPSPCPQLQESSSHVRNRSHAYHADAPESTNEMPLSNKVKLRHGGKRGSRYDQLVNSAVLQATFHLNFGIIIEELVRNGYDRA